MHYRVLLSRGGVQLIAWLYCSASVRALT